MTSHFRSPSWMCDVTSGHVTSGHVTSGHVTSTTTTSGLLNQKLKLLFGGADICSLDDI